MGWTQILMGDYAAARPNLTAALEADPDLADAYGYLGTLHFHQRNYEDAIVAFGPAIDLSEARSRRRTVQFATAAARTLRVPTSSPEVQRSPLPNSSIHWTFRRQCAGNSGPPQGGPAVSGCIRFDVLSAGRAMGLT